MMKKIKYLLFLIPLFFIFNSNVFAYTFYEDNNIVVDENFIYQVYEDTFPDYDVSVYPYLFCYNRTNDNFIVCYSLSQNDINNISYELFLSNPNSYIFNVPTAYSIYYDYSTYSLNYSYFSEFGDSFFVSDPLGYSNPDLGWDDVTKVGANFDMPSGVVLSGNIDVLCKYPNCTSEPTPPSYIVGSNKIYLPLELEIGMCPVILNKDTIRVYEELPTLNSSVNFTDFYITSHYITSNGTEIITEVPTCMDLENFTTSFYYRFDFDKILVIFVIVVGLVYFIVAKLLHAFFIGFKH